MPSHSLEKYTEETLQSVANFLHAISGNRYHILSYLNEMKSPVSWSDIMFGLRLNPKTQQHHLEILQSKGFIEHVEGYGYAMTTGGKKAFMLVDRCFRRELEHLEKAGYNIFGYKDKD